MILTLLGNPDRKDWPDGAGPGALAKPNTSTLAAVVVPNDRKFEVAP